MMLLDPRRPTLAELLALDQSDTIFVHQLYRHLLGREADPEGLAAYLGGLRGRGRLFMLAVMIASQESRDYRAHADIQLPSGTWVSRPVERLLAMGKPGKLMLLPLIGAFRTWEWWRSSSLAWEARSLRAEAGLQQLEEIEPALGRPRRKPGEAFVADMRAVLIAGGVAGAGVVHGDPAGSLQRPAAPPRPRPRSTACGQ
jgi:hypothetical protein